MLFQAAAIASLLALASALPERRAANPTVTVASGVLVGTATHVSNQPSVTALVNAFLGIPFASNPPALFQPPASPVAWKTALSVQTNKPICLEQYGPSAAAQKAKADFDNPIRGPPLAQSVSCLYVNVYVPPGPVPATDGQLKTVMVWFYGGNLQDGGNTVQSYNGSSLAALHDVIVVVPNYRTNIFGFSNSPDVPFGMQNSGFLDQRAALQWTQDNIKQFGGDPDKVTIFGESAGGYSVKQLLANPPAGKLPFRAAIMESSGFGVSGNSLDNFNNVAAHFNCPNPNVAGQTKTKCLANKDPNAILTYIENQGLNFAPVYGDGTDSGKHTNQNINAGNFSKVPIMTGSNNNEARIFLSEAGIDNSTSVVDGVRAITGFDISALNITALYPSADTDFSYILIDRIATDIVFTCPTSLLANLLTKRQPVWRYRYDAAFPDTSPYPNVGAYHSSEIFEVFGTYPLKTQFGTVTPTQKQLSAYMQTAWTNFAKNPTQGPGQNWNAYGNDGSNLGVLGGTNNSVGVSNQNTFFTADYPCVIYDPFLIALGDAY